MFSDQNCLTSTNSLHLATLYYVLQVWQLEMSELRVTEATCEAVGTQHSVIQ